MLAASNTGVTSKNYMARLRIREVAEAQGLDVAKLSRRADLAYRTVYKLWNNPEQSVSTKTLEKIAAALHVDVVDLIENGEKPPTT